LKVFVVKFSLMLYSK